MSMRYYLQVEVECDTRVKDCYGKFRCNKSFTITDKDVRDDLSCDDYETYITSLVDDIYNFVKKFRKENNYICNFSIDNLDIEKEILVKRIFNNYKGSYSLICWDNWNTHNYNNYTEIDIKANAFKKSIKTFVFEAIDYIDSKGD